MNCYHVKSPTKHFTDPSVDRLPRRVSRIGALLFVGRPDLHGTYLPDRCHAHTHAHASASNETNEHGAFLYRKPSCSHQNLDLQYRLYVYLRGQIPCIVDCIWCDFDIRGGVIDRCPWCVVYGVDGCTIGIMSLNSLARESRSWQMEKCDSKCEWQQQPTQFLTRS